MAQSSTWLDPMEAMRNAPEQTELDPRDYYKIGLEKGLIEGYEKGVQDSLLIPLGNFLKKLIGK